MADLSGGKASEDSLNRLIASLVAEYAVDFQLDLPLSVALGLAVFSGSFDWSSRPALTTDFVRSWAALSAMRERTVR